MMFAAKPGSPAMFLNKEPLSRFTKEFCVHFNEVGSEITLPSDLQEFDNKEGEQCSNWRNKLSLKK